VEQICSDNLLFSEEVPNLYTMRGYNIVYTTYGTNPDLHIFFYFPEHCNLSEDIQQSCLRVTINGI